MRLIIIQLFVSLLIFSFVSPTVAKTRPQLRNFSAGHYYLTAEDGQEISEYCRAGFFQTQTTRTGARLVLRPAADRDQIFYMTNENFTDTDEFKEGCEYNSRNRVSYLNSKTTLTYEEDHQCNKGASVLSYTKRTVEIRPDRITLNFSRSSSDDSLEYSCHWVKNNH